MGGARRITMIVALLVLVGGGAVVWVRSAQRARATRDFPDGIRMLCTNPECGRAFTTTLAEIARVRAGDEDADVPCPGCGKPAERGRECPNCHGTFRAGGAERGSAGDPACPRCHKALPRLAG